MSSQARHGKIAHVVRKWDPDEWGGIETHVAAIVGHLSQFGWQSELHAPRGPTSPDRTLPPDVSIKRYRSFVPFIGAKERRIAMAKNAGNIASFHLVSQLARDRDITLAHLHTGKRIGGAVRTAMRLTKRPYLVSVHGPLLADAEWMAAETESRYSGLWDVGHPIGALLGSRRVMHDAARVISFNDQERDALAKSIGSRSVRMDHGVDVAGFSSGSVQRSKQLWPQLEDKLVVVHIARLARQKNQLLTVQAFAAAQLPEHHLVFAGAATDDGYLAKVMAEVRAAGIEERVHILGNIEPKDVPHMLARAEIAVIPSVQEAFGLAVLEAWAAGKPVMFSRCAALGDLAKLLKDQTPVPEDLEVESWAAALKKLCSEADLRTAVAAEGEALVAGRFSWQRVAADLASLYQEILDESDRGHGQHAKGAR